MQSGALHALRRELFVQSPVEDLSRASSCRHVASRGTSACAAAGAAHRAAPSARDDIAIGLESFLGACQLDLARGTTPELVRALGVGS